jgi:mono/diheme cytochrome c family protein
MDTFGNAMLGIVFLLLSLAGTLLMYKLWGYSFDHEKLRSSAPPRLMLVHRLIGYAYAAIYIYLMTQMVPRLWSYEVEFPARTVAHLMLGMTIGVIIIVKVTIVRFFKHLESTLVPFLGTGLLICTCLLVGLSVPFALKETYLHRSAVGGTAFSTENIERVKTLLSRAGLPTKVKPEALATITSLKEGRSVLLSKCVQCHDLRTVLLKPRTPDNWVQTVTRMADRSIFNPIDEQEQWHVAAYLIAISPELQKTFRQKRDQDLETAKSKAVVKAIIQPVSMASAAMKTFDLAVARQTFEATCSQCHKLTNIDRDPPASAQEAGELVSRMVENGLDAPQDDLEQIVFYLTQTYAK